MFADFNHWVYDWLQLAGMFLVWAYASLLWWIAKPLSDLTLRLMKHAMTTRAWLDKGEE